MAASTVSERAECSGFEKAGQWAAPTAVSAADWTAALMAKNSAAQSAVSSGILTVASLETMWAVAWVALKGD